MTTISTTQKVITAGAAIGSAYYCYKNKKSILISSLVVVLSTAVGYFVGGYANTIMPSKSDKDDTKNATGFSCPRGSKTTIVKDEKGNKYYQCEDKRGVVNLFDGSGEKVW